MRIEAFTKMEGLWSLVQLKQLDSCSALLKSSRSRYSASFLWNLQVSRLLRVITRRGQIMQPALGVVPGHGVRETTILFPEAKMCKLDLESLMS